MAKQKEYIYKPRASYALLKKAETAIEGAETIDDLREVVRAHGWRTGYKALCYLLMGKMTPEAMKPKDAAEVARKLSATGKDLEAEAIRAKILEVHPKYPLDDGNNGQGGELPEWLEGEIDTLA